MAKKEDETPTIEAAINEFSEDDVDEGTGTEVASAEDDTDVDEGTSTEEEETTSEDDDEIPDLEDDDAWAPKVEDDEDEDEDDDEDDDEEEAAASDDDEVDIFDEMTPEQLKEVNANPTLRSLRKALMRGYNTKMAGQSQLIKLGEAYAADPVGVARAIAQANGLQVAGGPEAGQPPVKVDPRKAQLEKIETARKEVANLFGDEVGPEVAEKLEGFFNVLTEAVVAPLTNQVGSMQFENERTALVSQEAEWRNRNAKILTPAIEKKVVELGNSGKLVPSEDMPPGEYLDVLLKVVLAENADLRVHKARAGASKKLAKRIERNRASQEPTGTGSKSGAKPVSKLKTSPEDFTISDAFDEAARELKEAAGI